MSAYPFACEIYFRKDGEFLECDGHTFVGEQHWMAYSIDFEIDIWSYFAEFEEIIALEDGYYFASLFGSLIFDYSYSLEGGEELDAIYPDVEEMRITKSRTERI